MPKSRLEPYDPRSLQGRAAARKVAVKHGFTRRGESSRRMKAYLLQTLVALDAAALLGILGVLVGCLWALFKDRGTILTFQALGAGIFAAHFALLGASTAMVTCGVAAAQSLSAARLSGRPLLVVHASSAVVLAGAIVKTWQGLPSLFVALAATFATVGRLQREPQRVRCFFLGCTLAWVGHNLLTGSAFGLVSDLLSLTTLAVGLIRCHRSGE
jgi:hypothetical protein